MGCNVPAWRICNVRIHRMHRTLYTFFDRGNGQVLRDVVICDWFISWFQDVVDEIVLVARDIGPPGGCSPRSIHQRGRSVSSWTVHACVSRGISSRSIELWVRRRVFNLSWPGEFNVVATRFLFVSAFEGIWFDPFKWDFSFVCRHDHSFRFSLVYEATFKLYLVYLLQCLYKLASSPI